MKATGAAQHFSPAHETVCSVLIKFLEQSLAAQEDGLVMLPWPSTELSVNAQPLRTCRNCNDPTAIIPHDIKSKMATTAIKFGSQDGRPMIRCNVPNLLHVMQPWDVIKCGVCCSDVKLEGIANHIRDYTDCSMKMKELIMSDLVQERPPPVLSLVRLAGWPLVCREVPLADGNEHWTKRLKAKRSAQQPRELSVRTRKVYPALFGTNVDDENPANSWLLSRNEGVRLFLETLAEIDYR